MSRAHLVLRRHGVPRASSADVRHRLHHAWVEVSLLATVIGAVVATASTASAQQYEARTVAPPTPEHTPSGELMLGVTGGVLLGLPYSASIYAAATSNITSDRWLYAPVVGPWADLIARSTCRTIGCKGNVSADALPLVANGLAQTAGLALIVVALTTPSSEQTPPARTSPRRAAAGPTLHLVPESYAGGGGLAAFGTF